MKKTVIKIIYILTAVISLANTVATVYRDIFPDIASLPKGEIFSTADSPDGQKALNMYVVENTLGCAVRGEIVTADSTKNVFWQTDISSVDTYWADNDHIVINGVPLNVTKGDSYDCRNGTSLFAEGALADSFIQ